MEELADDVASCNRKLIFFIYVRAHYSRTDLSLRSGRISIIRRIGFLVSIQIALLIGSFAILAFYESQSALIGNSINVAGMNRYLTSVVILQAEKQVNGELGTSNLSLAINHLDTNIDVLRTGGTVGTQEIMPLPNEYLADWQLVDQERQELKDLINTQMETPVSAPENQMKFIAEIEAAGTNLVSASSSLVRHLSDGSKAKSESLIQMQISLLVINVAVHCVMLYLIVRIVKPIIAITKATNQIKSGNLDVAIEPGEGKDEISNLATSFNEMVENLRKYDTIQNEIINVAAHELRTPVQPLLGVADRLAIDIGDKDKIEITKAELEMIIRNAERLQHLSSEILDASRIESGRLALQKEPFDLIQTVSSAVQNVTKLQPRDNRLNVVIKESAESIILNADKKRIAEVISIVVANAVKFTETGSIRINAQKQNGYAVVSVTDTGTGVDSTIMPRLFTKFASGPVSGSGLALYIAKNIVEAHGGKIWAKNNEHEAGATFTFTVPMT